MRTLMISLAAAALMAGCAPVDVDPAGSPVPGEPTQCKAEQYRHFVGMNRASLPQAPADETWRVSCTTCAVTMDYNPARLNIVYDEATGMVREVKCG